MKTASAEELDRRIVGALLANPRATKLQISNAVFSSEATVSRRLSRLIHSGAVRVTGVLDGQVTGASRSVFVRLRCRPGEAERSARRLAEWPETGSVKLLTGSADCVAEVLYTSKEHLQVLTLERLPSLNGVLAVWSNQVIRRFCTPHSWMPELLPAEQIAQLRADRLDPSNEELPSGSVALTPIDRRIAAELAADGRMAWSQLAEHCGITAITARRRAETLMESGALRMRTVIEPSVIGLAVDAFISLVINPTQLSHAGTLLAAHPSVIMLAATTGDRNLCGEVSLASDAALYSFISESIGQLPGLQQADVALTLRSVKRAALLVDAAGDTADHGPADEAHHP